MARIVFTDAAVIGNFRLGKLRQGQHGKRLKLCSIEDYEFKSTRDGRAKRSVAEKQKFIDKLYNARLQELLVQKEKDQTTGLLVNKLMEDWLTYVKTVKTEITENRYRTTVDYYLRAVGNHNIEDFTYDKYLKFFRFLKKLRHRGKPLSEQRIRTHFRQLRVFYSWAFKQRIIDRAFYIELPEAEEKDPVSYKKGDLLRLKDVILKRVETSKRRDYRINRINDFRTLVLAPYLGFRRGAIWSLRLENIFLDSGTIKIASGLVDISPTEQVLWKNKKGKRVEKPMPEVLKKILKRDLEARGPKEKYYLDNGFGYTCYRSPAGLTKAFRQHRIEAEISAEVKPIHGFRSGCVNALIANNTNPSVI